MATWAFKELVRAELGDYRLSNRLIQIVDSISSQPAASIPQACGAAGAKSAYRFFNNDKVDPDQILAPHAQQTAVRARQYPVVLAPQDTTTFSFNDHTSKQDLGYVGSDRDSRGMFLHSMMLLSPAGTPLGIVYQKMWARDDSEYGKRKTTRQRTIENKESYRWLTSVQAVEQALPEHPCVVVIGDQESDIFDLFAAPRAANVHLLVRVRPIQRRVNHRAKYLMDALQKTPHRGELKLQVPRADDRRPRVAKLKVSWTTLEVNPPRNHPERKKFSPVTLQFLYVEEQRAPAGQKPIQWLLATTLPINNWEDAMQMLQWYSFRWRIERLHYVLKSGCRIEDLQLETLDRLKRAIACYLIVAWRLMWLMYESRENPDQSCAVILESHEWQSLYATVHRRKPLPKTPPTIREAVHMIAQLGGFLKHNGEPGLKTLWLGLRRLEDISDAWTLARTMHTRADPHATCGQ